jgi:hypothetical protein
MIIKMAEKLLGLQGKIYQGYNKTQSKNYLWK